MKRLVFLTFFMMLFTFSVAQDKKFSPEKFEADLAEYITKEAKLSDEEASKYFPLLREMHKKQRCIFKKKRNLGKEKPNSEGVRRRHQGTRQAGTGVEAVGAVLP